METAANQLGTPDLPAEIATHDDGGNPATSYEAPAPAAKPQEEGEQRAEPAQWKDDKRNEIFSRAREKRSNDSQPFSGDANDPDAMYGSNVDQSELGDLEREALRRQKEHLGQFAQQPQQQSNAPKPLNGINPDFLAQHVPIIVDGQEQTVPIEELVRNYQIDQAASKRLEQAKALLQQTQEFQRNQQPQPGRQDAEYDEPFEQDDSTRNRDDFDEPNGQTSRRPANVKDLVEKIQLGTPDEAAQALEDFVTSAVNRNAPVDETTRVLTALEDHNSQQAVIAFAEKNPQIAANPILRMEATKEIHRNMADDLIRAGYTLEQLQREAPTQQQLTQLHKQARIKGVRGVRQVSELVDAGYQGAMNNLRALVEQSAPLNAAPNQAPNMSQRMQRKEALQPQPAARRLSPGMTAPSQAKTLEQSRSGAVQRMRQARGQPT